MTISGIVESTNRIPSEEARKIFLFTRRKFLNFFRGILYANSVIYLAIIISRHPQSSCKLSTQMESLIVADKK